MSFHYFHSEITNLFTPDNILEVLSNIGTTFATFWSLLDAGDVQGTILFCLIVWLLINVVLIRIAWVFYGQDICNKSLKPGELFAGDPTEATQKLKRE